LTRFRHHRRSIRWRGYDYAANGVYYITICTQRRQWFLGDVEKGRMVLNALGRIADEEWLRSADLRAEVRLDAYVIMPNHFHALVIFEGEPPPTPTETPRLYRRPRSLSTLVSGFKGAVSRRVNALRETPGSSVWQRNYYDRVIRNASEFYSCRTYIRTNPAHWQDDPDRFVLSGDA
jgi:REP element-mobilizing transposase RayT